MVTDERLLNGSPRCTLIESFKGSVIVLGPTRECKTLHDSVEAAVKYIEDQGWKIVIDHIHGPKVKVAT